jgi:hypothetical protein
LVVATAAYRLLPQGAEAVAAAEAAVDHLLLPEVVDQQAKAE